MADTILMVGSKLIEHQSVIWSLLKEDYQIRYANNDSKAINIIATEKPSAVVLGLESGKSQEICLSIRSVAPATPLFVIGRERDTAIRLGLFQAGADDYIREPFDSIELIARIRSAVRTSKKQHLMGS
jgi:DNA-binding response OmpR family regulator